jgi:hypothetical protein
MSPGLFPTDTPPLSSENFPRWGMTRAGQLFPLPMLVLHTAENGGGALLNVPTPTSNDAEKRGDFDPVRSWGTAGYAKLWPTPTSSLGTNGGLVTPRKSREGGTLIEAVSARAFPTPSASDNRDRWNRQTPAIKRRIEKGKQMMLSMKVSDHSGQLNPPFVEWLMGWPLGWTGLKLSAMAKSQSKPRSPGESSEVRE